MEFDRGFPPGYLEMKWIWHCNPCQHILPVLHIIIHFYFLFSSYHAALVFACRNAVLVTQIFPLPLPLTEYRYCTPYQVSISDQVSPRELYLPTWYAISWHNHCSCLQKLEEKSRLKASNVQAILPVSFCVLVIFWTA